MSDPIVLTPEQIAELESQKTAKPDIRNHVFFDLDGVTVHGKRLRKVSVVSFAVLLDLENAFIPVAGREKKEADGRRQYQLMEFVWVHGAPEEDVARAVVNESRAQIAQRVMTWFSETFKIDQLEAVYSAVALMMERVDTASDFREDGSKSSGDDPPNITSPGGLPVT